MEFLKNHFYKICFNVGGKTLTYTVEIISDDENFVTFKDKFGKILTYNKLNIISSEEIGSAI